ncbi:tyrosine-type recombinase/integrase [Maridesulfovibrio ferrireducens]|uniref:tyrosine-type recombinase/integrase n=1 Tax=Maridesulfovibrio ferrireducens TaxID=246191 RepID=UPI001A30613C|nr:tyrosine-type recombinase/integrase [Maridesulfovibrio ferrireducens]MBI9110270.1 tyrosine-type recombinase/integrase [Maridesulfovibrio ferrireducens]
MKGCRPLKSQELGTALQSFQGYYAKRNAALLALGAKSGFRIFEILSIQVKDVVHQRKIMQDVSVQRKHMKRKIEGRTVFLNELAQYALVECVSELKSRGHISPETYVFKSRKGTNQAISVPQAWRVLNQVFKRLGFQGKLGTHCMRKTFVQDVYDRLIEMREDDHSIDPLPMLQMATGHKTYDALLKYLSFRNKPVRDAIRNI